MGLLINLLEYRYAKFYRAQVALWRSHGLGPSACHQIAAHLCRDEFIGRLKPAAMKAVNARLLEEPPPMLPSPNNAEEAVS